MRTLVLILLYCFSFPAGNDDKKDNDLLLNAESSSTPREINIGLPDSGDGAVVYVDGCKHALGLPKGRFHWAGGNAYERIGTISLMESVIRVGEIGVLVDSHTKTGGATFGGVVTAGTSSNGRILLDAFAGGPVLKNTPWTWSAGAFINYDPTAVNAPGRRFIDRKQIYQATLLRRVKDSQLCLIYRISFSGDSFGNAYNVAPFIYNGDGSVSFTEGFRPGRDCYFPSDAHIRYMDVACGEMKSGNLNGLDRVITHDLNLVYSKKLSRGWKYDTHSHVCFMPTASFARTSLAGIDNAGVSSGYTTADGAPFAGNVQKRLTVLENERTFDLESDHVFKKNLGRHGLKAGLNLVYCNQYEAGSSFHFAHSVEAEPQRLYKGGAETWNLNTNSLYFDARRFCPTLYIFDRWQAGKKTMITTGLRLKGSLQSINTAAVLEGQTKNVRVDGFNIADPSLCSLNHFDSKGLDYAASLSLIQGLLPGWFAVAEGFYSMTNKTSVYYRNATIPSLKPIGNAMARVGFTHEGKRLDAGILFSYITCWNCAAVLNVTSRTSSGSVTIPWTAEYGIGTPGVTLDANLEDGRFRLHAQATFQNPVYLDYGNSFDFGDGKTTLIDYSGNVCTGISRVIAEAQPSYSLDRLRFWLTLRYYSRQYVSRTNLASFSGHVETFGGIDWHVCGPHSVSLDFVNIFLQGGMKGSVDIADTITDIDQIKGYLMAGTYIRPFSIDLKYTFRF